MKLTINGKTLHATMENNSSAQGLLEKLECGPLTLHLNDYARVEKVGDLGFRLPKNDRQITTAPGDLILYMGNQFVLYYAPNTWRFTRLGRIDGADGQQLKSLLGGGRVDVTLSRD